VSGGSGAAGEYKAWPFQEARQIVKQRPSVQDRTALFETGFGPSGLPHIGTFAEVARTSWVRHAYSYLYDTPSRLVAFSDDMDGLRKVPVDLPEGDMLARHLGKPLHTIPDPFGCCDSYSGHMNQKLRDFLDAYGFDYEFQSSSEAYGRGDFDEGLTILLQKVEEVRAVILPTLGEDKRADWSPFFPVCPQCGSVYATRVTGYQPESAAIEFACDQDMGDYAGCGAKGELSVLGGNVKVGWKVDWALRWYTYEVDYEMFGKDLIDSARLSGRLVRIMGRQPPAGLTYELFLDDEGRKISKSVGKGLKVDTWVQYAPIESLLYYLYQNPKRAKRLFWDVVPRCVDDYLDELRRYGGIVEDERPDTALWHIYNRGEAVPEYGATVNFSVVNNLIAALGTDSSALLLDYLQRYDQSTADHADVVSDLVDKALNYYRDQILPTKEFRSPSDDERALLNQIKDRLAECGNGNEEELQSIPFSVARDAGIEPKELFQTIYQVLLGQERGPRFGSFVNMLGKARMLQMLEEKVAG
jgi:lysyl-tRNA synthetase class 1